ncbi:hypothetical protein GQ600_4960 [Phytophthora cactorum]|nr:hypothetical protein GQ600_4960 [Phytophthora cactorum]
MVSPRGIHSYTYDMDSPRFVMNAIDLLNSTGCLSFRLRMLVSIIALTRVMRGECYRCIRSHYIAFDCSPGPPIVLLPR